MLEVLATEEGKALLLPYRNDNRDARKRAYDNILTRINHVRSQHGLPSIGHQALKCRWCEWLKRYNAKMADPRQPCPQFEQLHVLLTNARGPPSQWPALGAPAPPQPLHMQTPMQMPGYPPMPQPMAPMPMASPMVNYHHQQPQQQPPPMNRMPPKQTGRKKSLPATPPYSPVMHPPGYGPPMHPHQGMPAHVQPTPGYYPEMPPAGPPVGYYAAPNAPPMMQPPHQHVPVAVHDPTAVSDISDFSDNDEDVVNLRPTSNKMDFKEMVRRLEVDLVEEDEDDQNQPEDEEKEDEESYTAKRVHRLKQEVKRYKRRMVFHGNRLALVKLAMEKARDLDRRELLERQDQRRQHVDLFSQRADLIVKCLANGMVTANEISSMVKLASGSHF